MKKVIGILILTIFFIECENSSYQIPRGLSDDQIKMKSLVDRYSTAYDAAPNKMTKEKIRKSFLDSFSNYLADTLKFHLHNCKVKLTELKTDPIQDIVAFYATFKDSLDNQYWMEFDYPKNKSDSISKNPAYALLQNMPENIDTVLSFFYMGEVQWKDELSDYDNELKIRVVPLSKNFNFDSAKNINTSVKKLKQKQ